MTDLSDQKPPQQELQEEQASDSGSRRAWVSPLLAVLMLVTGLFLGYFGRPYIQPLLAGEADATPVAELPATSAPPASGEPTPTLMEFLISNARHFKGDPDAPVTMIEFSDYK